MLRCQSDFDMSTKPFFYKIWQLFWISLFSRKPKSLCSDLLLSREPIVLVWFCEWNHFSCKVKEKSMSKKSSFGVLERIKNLFCKLNNDSITEAFFLAPLLHARALWTQQDNHFYRGCEPNFNVNPGSVFDFMSCQDYEKSKSRIKSKINLIVIVFECLFAWLGRWSGPNQTFYRIQSVKEFF